MFKDTVKSLNEVNRAWEDSYNSQSEDLVTHGMEISRLQAQVSDLKRAIVSTHQTSNLKNRDFTVQTLQGDHSTWGL